MKKINIKLLVILFAVMAIASCRNENEEEARTLEVEEVENITPGEGEVGGTETTTAHFDNAGLQSVFNSYLNVKNALVASNAEEAKSAASQMQVTLTNVDANEALTEATETIANTTDVEEQREAFYKASQELEKMVEGTVTSGRIYKQHCPMAFDDKGASWLSESQIIQNPYFGDKMLRCGSVEKTFE